jgi:hypothetical protein
MITGIGAGRSPAAGPFVEDGVSSALQANHARRAERVQVLEHLVGGQPEPSSDPLDGARAPAQQGLDAVLRITAPIGACGQTCAAIRDDFAAGDEEPTQSLQRCPWHRESAGFGGRT